MACNFSWCELRSSRVCWIYICQLRQIYNFNSVTSSFLNFPRETCWLSTAIPSVDCQPLRNVCMHFLCGQRVNQLDFFYVRNLTCSQHKIYLCLPFLSAATTPTESEVCFSTSTHNNLSMIAKVQFIITLNTCMVQRIRRNIAKRQGTQLPRISMDIHGYYDWP